MKKNDLAEIKGLDIKAIMARVKKVRDEITESVMDKKMGKMKDLKTIYKKKKDVAQMLTVIRQKELLEQLEPNPSTGAQGHEESKMEGVIA